MRFAIPSGLVGTHGLQCRAADDDCAVFLESQKPQFEAAGYTALLEGIPAIQGYAYDTLNSDSDQLPDALERVIGTRIDLADTDADGLADHVEFPLAGIPVSDPCNVGAPNCTSLPETIFANGFE